MNNYVHRGEKITVTAPYNVTSGGGCLVGGIFGIAQFTALSGASVELLTVGSIDLAKDTSTFNEGDPVYWDNVNLVATANSQGVLIGYADLVQASGTNAAGGNSADATVRVRLNETYASAGGSLTLVVSLTASQLIAMEAAPITLIAAPAAGKAILVDNILFEMTTTATAFTGGGAVDFVYHGGSVAVHAGSIPAATVTAAAGTSNTYLGPAVATNGTVVPAATGVDITNATAPFAAGTGTAKVQIRYRVVTL